MICRMRLRVERARDFACVAWCCFALTPCVSAQQAVLERAQPAMDVSLDPLHARERALENLQRACEALLRATPDAASAEVILEAAQQAFATPISPAGRSEAELARARDAYRALVVETEDAVTDAGTQALAAGTAAPSTAATCAILTRLLHVDDRAWADADTDVLKDFLTSDAARSGLERFLLERRRPLTAYSVVTRGQAKPVALGSYIQRQAAMLSMLDKKAQALATLQAGAAKLAAMEQRGDAAPLRARAAELLEEVGTPAAAAAEVRAALDDARDEDFGRWSVQHVRYVFAARDDSGVVSLVGEYLDDPRTASWRPHLLFAGWGAKRRSQLDDAGSAWFERLVAEYPTHALTAQACFGVGAGALARGKDDDVQRMLRHLRTHFPKHELTAKLERLVSTHGER